MAKFEERGPYTYRVIMIIIIIIIIMYFYRFIRSKKSAIKTINKAVLALPY